MFAVIVVSSMIFVKQSDESCQNMIRVGSENCSIMAHNFVTLYFEISKSAKMCNQALHNLLRYYIVVFCMLIVCFLYWGPAET